MLRHIGHLIGFIVASALSPTWPLTQLLLKNYINLDHALTDPNAFLMEYGRFQLYVAQHPQIVFTQILPGLVLIFILGSSFMVVFTKLSGQALTAIEKFSRRHKFSH